MFLLSIVGSDQNNNLRSIQMATVMWYSKHLEESNYTNKAKSLTKKYLIFITNALTWLLIVVAKDNGGGKILYHILFVENEKWYK